MIQRMPGLGIDIGGPIIKAKGGSTPEGYRRASATPGAFAALRILSATYGDRIRLISQCDEHVQAAKLAWMEEQHFVKRTRIPLERIHFVRQQPEKADVCIEHGLTAMIEDKAVILDHARGHVRDLYLFAPDPAELVGFPELMAEAVVVPSWRRLLPFLLRS